MWLARDLARWPTSPACPENKWPQRKGHGAIRGSSSRTSSRLVRYSGHLRCTIDLYREISVPLGSGEPGADEQFVAVLGKHLRGDRQVLVERCELCANTVHLLDEQKTASFAESICRLTSVGSEEPGPRVVAIISVVAPAQNPFNSSSGLRIQGKTFLGGTIICIIWKDFLSRWRNSRKRGCPNRSFRRCRRLSFFHRRLISKMPPSSEIDYAPDFDARVRSIAFLHQ
jgi:hypothetical protein